MSIGENIKKYRNERGISQEKLAVKLNISSRTLQSYESDKTSPTIDVTKRIAIALDVPFLKIIEGDESFSEEDIKNIKNNPFNSMKPSDINKIYSLINEESEIIAALLKYVNQHYCNNEYDLQKITTGNAPSDIRVLLIDLIKNRLRYYDNLSKK